MLGVVDESLEFVSQIYAIKHVNCSTLIVTILSNQCQLSVSLKVKSN